MNKAHLSYRYNANCILLGTLTAQYAEYEILANSKIGVRRKLKNHIKQTYPKRVAYTWVPFSLKIKRIA